MTSNLRRMVMARITLQMLYDFDACEKQMDKFKEYFGEEVNVSVALARRVADVFDWRWAAEEFLTGDFSQQYYNSIETAYRVWRDTFKPERDAYDAIAHVAGKELDNKWMHYHGMYQRREITGDGMASLMEPHHAAYENAVKDARQALHDAEDRGHCAYREACAVEFARLYIEQEDGK
jgi:hypothetical protein